ncbi:hypothetical protein SD10_15950 [Spirosoma radiotolerans]|uniref:Uncharacterized protein n=1 Tax=Spirosoma radiotolerans TaxID=1379870 RepID=A0A0E4A0R0_9BACT|nr:hypothetical protein SD10_15950 [Spirosoma radiotolerans]
MYITREAYDLKPLLIKQGALFLWGVHLTKWTDNHCVHHLYRFNDFYVEMCCDKQTNRLLHIATFASPHRLISNLGKMNLFQIDQSI